MKILSIKIIINKQPFFHNFRRFLMKSIIRFTLITICTLAVISNVASAQSVSEQLSKMGSQAVKGYVTPAFLGWATDLNSGIYHSADLHDILGFDVQVKVAANLVKDENKKYTFIPEPQYILSAAGQNVTLTRGVDYADQIDAPTLFGEDKDVDLKIKNAGSGASLARQALNGKTLLTLPRGVNLPFAGVPLAWFQGSIGLPFGFEVMGRFLPPTKLGDAGKINVSGFGVRYDIDQWLPMFPIDIAVHFMTTKFNLKDSVDNNFITGKGTAYGVEISKRLLFITLYGGYQMESGSVTLNDFTANVLAPDPNNATAAWSLRPVPIKGFTVDNENKSRLTVGLRMLLLLVNIHAEYSFTKTPTAALGVGITLR